MKQLNCLIVDDEPEACDIIVQYCSHLPYLNVTAVCGNAFEAKTVLADHQIDIVFLDIQMPVLDGLSFLKTLKHQAQIIFTSAYSKYAVDAFDLTACDYLLKPFSLERFMMAVDKAIAYLNATTNKTFSEQEGQEDYFFIKAEGKIYKVKYDELLFAEAKGNYTKLVTSGKTIMPAISFTNFEKLLVSHLFIRVHRSFIVNKSKVESIEGNMIRMKNIEIPIGNHYKENFLNSLGL
jgi:two-component system, LytTR family, response regulator